MEYDVSIIGLGYVGLSTGICFANRGIKVLGIDIDQKKIQKIRKGKSPIFEKNMSILLKKVVKNGKLRVQSNYDEIFKSKIIFLAVGTPSNIDGSINLKYIKTAIKNIGLSIKKSNEYFLIVIKSTVIPNTSEKIIKDLERYSGKICGTDFGIIVNPEFLQEGKAVQNTLYPDRIIIGHSSQKDKKIIMKLYKKIYRKVPPVVYTNPNNAELIKYSTSTFLALKISYINYIARLAENIPGGDIVEIKTAMSLDKRISESFLNAGLGFGGSCFPKDIRAIKSFSKDNGINSDILKSIIEINRTQPLRVITMVKKKLGNVKKKNISILGLSFKPGTDDMRDAVSIIIIKKLVALKAKIKVYDPIAIDNAKRIFGNSIQYSKNPVECIKNTDCCILVTEWSEFKNLKPKDFVKQMNRPLLIDGRRLYEKSIFKNYLEYNAIGLS